MRDVDKFRDGHPRGHIAPLQDLIGSGAKDGAQDGIDAGQPPALGKLLVDQRIDLELLAYHAIDEVAEEGGLSVGILATLDLLAESMRLELGDYLVEVEREASKPSSRAHIIVGSKERRAATNA